MTHKKAPAKKVDHRQNQHEHTKKMLGNLKHHGDENMKEINRVVDKLNDYEKIIKELQQDVRKTKELNVRKGIKELLSNRKKQHAALKKYFNTLAKFRH